MLKGDSFELAGIQFDGIATGATLTDIIKPSFAEICWDVTTGETFVHEDWLDRAPQIQIPFGNSYLIYYYVTKAWDDAAQDFTPDGVGVWADMDGMKVEPTSESGVGFWLKSPKTGADGQPATEGCSFTICGQVPGGKTVERSGTSFTLAAMPAPVNLALDDEKITWNLTSVKCWNDEGDDFDDPDWLTKTPQIQIPNGQGGYLIYYYVNRAWDDGAQDFTPAGVGVWADDGGMKISQTIPAGVGLWFLVPNAGEGKFGFSLADVTK